MVQLGTKQCNQCHHHKALDQFGSANGGKGTQPSCRECMKARRAKWGQDNAQRLQLYDKNRYVKLPRKTYTYDDKMRFWIARAGICLCCAKPIAIDELLLAQLDHIDPLSKGGSDTDENIALAHKKCNEAKHNKKLEDHWIWRYNRKMDAVKLSWLALDNVIIAARYKK